LKLHANTAGHCVPAPVKQLLDAHKIMSGRCGSYVYSWWKGKLHRRRYVVPRDPRTPAQRRSRGAFGKAAKAWSENVPLTEAQRHAWYATAAKIKSSFRLGLSGFRTAQQHFVGSNALKQRWGLPLLLEPPTGRRQKAQARRQNTEFSAQVQQPQRLVRPTWVLRCFRWKPVRLGHEALSEGEQAHTQPLDQVVSSLRTLNCAILSHT
jgi:hypothetical protein